MPRKTAKKEAEDLFKSFLESTNDKLLTGIKSTRQPQRRRELLAKLDALDLFEAEFYNYLNGLGDAAA